MKKIIVGMAIAFPILAWRGAELRVRQNQRLQDFYYNKLIALLMMCPPDVVRKFDEIHIQTDLDFDDIIKNMEVSE